MEKFSRILTVIFIPSALFSGVISETRTEQQESFWLNDREMKVQKEIMAGEVKEIMDPLYKKNICSGFIMIGSNKLTCFTVKLANQISGGERYGWHDMEYTDSKGENFYAVVGRNMPEKPGSTELIRISFVKIKNGFWNVSKIIQPEGTRLVNKASCIDSGFFVDFFLYETDETDPGLTADFYERRLKKLGYDLNLRKTENSFCIHAIKETEEISVAGGRDSGKFMLLVIIKNRGEHEVFGRNK